MEVLTWGGLVAPAHTPDDRIERLNAAANAALETPELRNTLLDSGYDVVGGSPVAFGGFLRQELRKWSEVVRRGKSR
jgi:tripartite-type tricarboxylate transporter receptor subunit TctC